MACLRLTLRKTTELVNALQKIVIPRIETEIRARAHALAKQPR